ncbi:MAG: hypothetical protein ABW092_13560 [Candidatus Thiodiazotropha sp.]
MENLIIKLAEVFKHVSDKSNRAYIIVAVIIVSAVSFSSSSIHNFLIFVAVVVIGLVYLVWRERISDRANLHVKSDIPNDMAAHTEKRSK